jgi:hypothetical protein
MQTLISDNIQFENLPQMQVLSCLIAATSGVQALGLIDANSKVTFRGAKKAEQC